MSALPKLRPAEYQRQNRLLHLYDWGKHNIPEDEMFETIALNRLTDQAQGEFSVTYVTALGYAKVVLHRLKLEKKREIMEEPVSDSVDAGVQLC